MAGVEDSRAHREDAAAAGPNGEKWAMPEISADGAIALSLAAGCDSETSAGHLPRIAVQVRNPEDLEHPKAGKLNSKSGHRERSSVA